MTPSTSTSLLVEPRQLDDKLGAIRLREPGAVEQMRRSLQRHGQLSPLEVFSHEGVLQVLDGFKRLAAARHLDWNTLRVNRHELSVVDAKLRLAELHAGRGLSALEEGWLVRSLVVEHGLSQGAIGQRLGRHKSWVCRRLMLAEALDDKLQAHVRLGLVAPRTAVALAALPRGNQPAACQLVMQQGLTVHQTELLVRQILSCNGPDSVQRVLDEARKKLVAPSRATRSLPHKARNPLELMGADIGTLQRCASRLQARLRNHALAACPDDSGAPFREALGTLSKTLEALVATIDDELGATSRRAAS